MPRPNTGKPPPLSHDERRRLESVVRRLRAELMRVVRSVPLTQRTAAGLSDILGVDRNLSQRLLAGLSSSLDEVHAVAALPGVQGLAGIIDRASRMNLCDTQGAQRSLEQYSLLVRDLGGSQARLVARLKRGTTPSNPEGEVGGVGSEDPLDHQFRAACELAGYCVDLRYTIGLAYPSSRNTPSLDFVQAVALLGIRSLGEGVPITSARSATAISAGATTRVDADVSVEDLGVLIQGVSGTLREYSSDPPPQTSVERRGGVQVETIDPRPGEPFDWVSGSRRRGLSLVRVDADSVQWATYDRFKHPTQACVIDHYLHRQFAERWKPASACYFWGPGLTGHPIYDWNERAPVPTVLRTFKAVDESPLEGVWASAPRLTSQLFEVAGMNPSDFIGYRVRLRKPVWGSVHYLSFVLGPDSGEDNGRSEPAS